MNVTEEEFATLEVLEGEVLYSVNQETLHIMTATGSTDVVPAPAPAPESPAPAPAPAPAPEAPAPEAPAA
jgi:hypothetical protein